MRSLCFGTYQESPRRQLLGEGAVLEAPRLEVVVHLYTIGAAHDDTHKNTITHTHFLTHTHTLMPALRTQPALPNTRTSDKIKKRMAPGSG